MITSRHLRIVLAGLASMLAIGTLVSPDARAGIVVISRESTINIEGFGQDVPFSDSASFTGSGTFNDSVSGQEGDAPDGLHARAQAAQNTTVNFSPGGGPFSGSGRLSAEAFARAGGGTLNLVSDSDSILRIVFEVTGNNEPFTASGTFDLLNFPGDIASFGLVETSEPPTGSSPVSFFAGNNQEPGNELTFDSGLLSLRPATYTIAVTAQTGSSGTGPGGSEPFGQQAGIDFNFTVGQAQPPPPPPGVIPLPAGVWAGMIGLTAAAGAVTKSRRTRAR